MPSTAAAASVRPADPQPGSVLCGHREAHRTDRVCTYPAGHSPIVDPFADDPDYALMLAGSYDHGDAPEQSWWNVCRERGCWCTESAPYRATETTDPHPAAGSLAWRELIAARRAAGWRCGRGLAEGHCDDPDHQPHTSTHTTAGPDTPPISAQLLGRLRNLAVDLHDDGDETTSLELTNLLDHLPARP